MRNIFKVTCENGEHWVTEMNCNLEEAEKYFLLKFKVYENFETGQETKVLITDVKQLNCTISKQKSKDMTLNEVLSFLGFYSKPSKRYSCRDIYSGNDEFIGSFLSQDCWAWLHNNKYITE